MLTTSEVRQCSYNVLDASIDSSARIWGFRKNRLKYFFFVHVELFRGSL